MIKSISDLTKKELYGKKILLRVDFNVPVENGKISEIYRIKASKETMDYLTGRGAIIALLSHITAVDSFEPIFSQIKDILGIELVFIPECIGGAVKTKLNIAAPGNVFLLENVRKNEGEEKNILEFAEKLAKPFDIYINDAFSASHRDHASITSVIQFLPSYAGLLMTKEIEHLARAINMPKENKTLILGGAKIETKFPVITNFLDKAENILIGGAVANVFLKAKGIVIGESLTDDKFLEDAKNLINSGAKIIIPEDYIESECMILDIGKKTTAKFSEIIKGSKNIIWNGPLGKSEIEQFSGGTKKIAEAIVNSDAFSIVGGGDTIAFLEKDNIINKFGYISTGGGAMLEFLAGNKLPGLVALGYDE